MGKAQNKPQFYCENTEIPITDDFEVLGITMDDKLKFEKHVLAKVCRRVSQQVAVLKHMKKLLPFETSSLISTIAPKPGTSAVKVPVQN